MLNYQRVSSAFPAASPDDLEGAALEESSGDHLRAGVETAGTWERFDSRCTPEIFDPCARELMEPWHAMA